MHLARQLADFRQFSENWAKKLTGEVKNWRHGHQNIGGRVSAAGIAVLAKNLKKNHRRYENGRGSRISAI